MQQVSRNYTGPQNSEAAVAMKNCDSEGPLCVHITKLFHASDAQSFRAFGRIMSGTLKRGAPVKVLGEGFSPEDEEDMVKAVVDEIWICQSRLVCPKYASSDPLWSKISHRCSRGGGG